MVIFSLAVHALLLALLLWLVQPGPGGQVDGVPDPASIDVVFQGGEAAPTSVAHTPDKVASLASGDPSAQPKPVAKPLPQPEATPPVASEAPTPPTPEEPSPPTPSPTPPRVDLTPPQDTEPSPLPIPPVQPPPPLPRPPTPPKPRPQVLARPAEPRSPSGFPRPQNYSFGAPSGPTQLGAAGGQAAQTNGPFQPAPHITGAQLGSDWIGLYSAWVQRHLYYPQQAAENGEDGSAEVVLVVDRSGRVQSVELVGRSGSQWLDLAIQALFRRQIVPPFPPGTKDDTATIDQTIHYILRRR
jgi:protein TonB